MAMKSPLRLVREVCDDELASGVIERAHHRDFLGLSGRWHAQIRASPGPGAGEIGMRQSFALVGEQKDDVARLGLRLAQLEPQADAVDGVFVLTPFQRVARTAQAEPPHMGCIQSSSIISAFVHAPLAFGSEA